MERFSYMHALEMLVLVQSFTFMYSVRPADECMGKLKGTCVGIKMQDIGSSDTFLPP